VGHVRLYVWQEHWLVAAQLAVAGHMIIHVTGTLQLAVMLSSSYHMFLASTLWMQNIQQFCTCKKVITYISQT